jgi:hypothetical protein
MKILAKAGWDASGRNACTISIQGSVQAVYKLSVRFRTEENQRRH